MTLQHAINHLNGLNNRGDKLANEQQPVIIVRDHLRRYHSAYINPDQLARDWDSLPASVNGPNVDGDWLH